MLLVSLPFNSGLLVKFSGSQKLYTDFWLDRESLFLIPTLFKGYLCIHFDFYRLILRKILSEQSLTLIANCYGVLVICHTLLLVLCVH